MSRGYIRTCPPWLLLCLNFLICPAKLRSQLIRRELAVSHIVYLYPCVQYRVVGHANMSASHLVVHMYFISDLIAQQPASKRGS